MGTRRREAQRRQVSLAVEALEDRFLLSSAAALSIPAQMHEPSVHFAAHNSAANNETRYASPQQAPTTYVSSASGVPVNPMMVPHRDEDGDYDEPPGIKDADAPHSVALGLALPFFFCNYATDGLDLVFPSRSPEQITAPSANPIAYLPLISASGLGAASMISLVPMLSKGAASGDIFGNQVPDSGAGQMQPLPHIPDSTPSILPPPADESADPPSPLSRGRVLGELLPIDVEAIQGSVDAFFQQLGSLSGEWRDGRLIEKLAPWLLAASIAGYGWIQLRDKRRTSAQTFLADFPCLRSGLVDATIFPRGEEG